MSYAFNMDEILMRLDQRRSSAKKDQNKRREEVYDKIPEIKEIDDKLREVTILAIRNNIHSTDDKEGVGSIAALAELQKKNDILSAKKRKLLIEHGYDEDYLEIRYICPLCKDEGYVNGEKCRCLKQMIIEERYRQSNIARRLSEENFSTFDISYYSKETASGEEISPYENIKNILDRAKKYIHNFESQRGSIIIFGETGRG